MTLVSSLCALALLLAGAVLLAFAALCVIVVLAGRDCGPAFGYYGCATPPAHIRTEGAP